MKRMSTGSRINSAQDDAAGYAVSQYIGVQLSSYGMAKDNTEMGVSYVNTAGSTLDIVSSHIQRIRNLAEEACNGTYTDDSRKAMQAEVDQRITEVNRLLSTTEFNGKKLFQNASSTSSTSVSKFTDSVSSMSDADAVAAGYIVINNASDLQNITDMSGKYILSDNIDLSTISNFTGIGTSGNPFTGELNGNGYVISNLSVSSSSGASGLFGYIDSGTVKNLGLEDVDINSTSDYAGSIAGYSTNATIDNCYAKGDVSANSDVGGLVGYASTNSHISDSYFSGGVKGSDSNTGGIAGVLDSGSTISNSHSGGVVSGETSAGGIVGSNQSSTIMNSYSTAYLHGSSSLGGIAGVNSGTINNVLYNSDNDLSIGSDSGTSSSIVALTNTQMRDSATMSGYGFIVSDSIDTGPVMTNFQVGISSQNSSVISIDTSLEFSLDVDLSHSDTARDALGEIDDALSKITAKQSELGVIYNRLQTNSENIDTYTDNLTASVSLLKDTDVAEASSDYIKQKILQQSASVLLTTANQSPSIALSLINIKV